MATTDLAAVTNQIQKFWAPIFMPELKAGAKLPALVNRDYEGEIKSHGDKVHIRTKPTITIKTYLADAALELERPQGGQVILNIDQGQYFNTILDDVMKDARSGRLYKRASSSSSKAAGFE